MRLLLCLFGIFSIFISKGNTRIDARLNLGANMIVDFEQSEQNLPGFPDNNRFNQTTIAGFVASGGLGIRYQPKKWIGFEALMEVQYQTNRDLLTVAYNITQNNERFAIEESVETATRSVLPILSAHYTIQYGRLVVFAGGYIEASILELSTSQYEATANGFLFFEEELFSNENIERYRNYSLGVSSGIAINAVKRLEIELRFMQAFTGTYENRDFFDEPVLNSKLTVGIRYLLEQSANRKTDSGFQSW